MRPIWNGSLSFGLVNIPIRLFSASKERSLSFRLLSKDDHCPISYQKVCREDGSLVDQKDIVRGFEYEEGEYVILEDEDFKKADARKTETIDIVRFSDQADIDPKLYEKPYYVSPDRRAGKAYALLRDALERTNKVGIARYVMKEKEYVGAVVPEDDILVLNQLRFHDEIREPEGIDLPKGKLYEKKEMDMALSLILSMTEKFRPKDFKDTWTDEVMKMIEAKAKKKRVKIKGAEEAPEATDMKDILAALKRSLEHEKRMAKAH